MKITDPKQIKKRKTVKGVIRQVRRLLSDYENWLQEGFQDQKEDGRFCYCLAGAIDAVAANDAVATEAKQAVVQAIPSRFKNGAPIYVEGEEDRIWDLNDGAFHKYPRNAWKAVLKTLDRALAN